ncbi:MAG: hypothetical protein ACE5G1_15265 [bacterium]
MKSTCSPLSGFSQGLRKLSLLLVLTFASNTLWAQPVSYVQAQNSYFFDFLTFKAFEGDNTFLEIFCKLPLRTLKFTSERTGFTAHYSLDISLFDKDNVRVHSASHADSVKVQTYKEVLDVTTYSKVIRFTFVVKPGVYQAHVTVADNGSFTFKGFRRELNIPNYCTRGLHVSDLQVANAITLTDRESMFVKNGREILPNVSHIYGLDSNILYVYNEIYNLQYEEKNRDNEFMATYTIFGENGHKVKKIKRKQFKPGDGCAFSLGIPVGDLESGQYKLVMEVVDLDNSQTARKQTLFHVIRTSSNRKTVI